MMYSNKQKIHIIIQELKKRGYIEKTSKGYVFKEEGNQLELPLKNREAVNDAKRYRT